MASAGPPFLFRILPRGSRFRFFWRWHVLQRILRVLVWNPIIIANLINFLCSQQRTRFLQQICSTVSSRKKASIPWWNFKKDEITKSFKFNFYSISLCKLKILLNYEGPFFEKNVTDYLLNFFSNVII